MTRNLFLALICVTNYIAPLTILLSDYSMNERKTVFSGKGITRHLRALSSVIIILRFVCPRKSPSLFRISHLRKSADIPLLPNRKLQCLPPAENYRSRLCSSVRKSISPSRRIPALSVQDFPQDFEITTFLKKSPTAMRDLSTAADF